MTRKDYIAIAEALRNAAEVSNWDGNRDLTTADEASRTYRENARTGVLAAAHYIANAMQDDNPRFDREHFLAVVERPKLSTE